MQTLEEWKKEQLTIRMRIFENDKRKVAESFGVSLKTIYTWLAEGYSRDTRKPDYATIRREAYKEMERRLAMERAVIVDSPIGD